jgi:hypothetical protein
MVTKRRAYFRQKLRNSIRSHEINGRASKKHEETESYAKKS